MELRTRGSQRHSVTAGLARPRRRRRRRLRRFVVVFAILAALTVSAVLVGRNLLPIIRPPSCEVTGASGGWFGFEPERLDNAATISAVAVKRGLPPRAAVIATATAMQESKLRNLAHGDRDSLGVFQQRPSQGWGTREQILDPVYATNAFYDRLRAVPGFLTRPLTTVAQQVQRSGYPDAYARHEEEARALVDAFTGATPAGVTCRLERAMVSQPVAKVRADLTRELGVPSTGDAQSLTARLVTQEMAWAVGAWAVGHAERAGIASVTVGDRTWTRAKDGSALTWEPSGATADPHQVVVRMAYPALAHPPQPVAPAQPRASKGR